MQSSGALAKFLFSILMTLFCKDSNGKYTHVAFYIGEGLAIESNVRTKKYPAGVHIINVEDENFVECALLNGIYYTYYDNLVE